MTTPMAAQPKTRIKPARAVSPKATPGRCRWCRCTHYEPCEGGCGWANRQQTVCTACIDLDIAMRTVAGRQALAQFLQTTDFNARDRK